MCARKYMFGTSLRLVYAKMVKTKGKKFTKKGPTRKNIFVHTRDNYPSFNEKLVSHFSFFF